MPAKALGPACRLEGLRCFSHWESEVCSGIESCRCRAAQSMARFLGRFLRFVLGDGQPVPAEVEVGVLQRLGQRHPRVNLLLLLGLKGNEQQIKLANQIVGKGDLVFVESVGGNGGEDHGLALIGALRGKNKG